MKAAYQKYKTTSVQSASREKLLLMLYEAAIRFIKKGIKAIEEKDIALGMSSAAVKESWGDPDIVEVAGDTVYGYERWRYQRIVSGNDGYQKELRSVQRRGV